jgi:hypothetical protein
MPCYRKPVPIQSKQGHSRYDLCRLTVARKIPGTSPEPVHHLCGSHQSFDTASKEELWKIMVKYSCPPTFILNVSQFHDG